VEETAIKRSLIYFSTAIVLGLVMMLVPTWFFVGADEYGKAAYSVRDANSLPFFESTEHNHIETVSSDEVGILALSFVIASMIYFIFKRKTLKHEHIWPPFRLYSL